MTYNNLGFREYEISEHICSFFISHSSKCLIYLNICVCITSEILLSVSFFQEKKGEENFVNLPYKIGQQELFIVYTWWGQIC